MKPDTIQDPEISSADVAFDTTVPRELVHKRAIHEVLLTDAKQVSDDVIALAAQLPRSHSFYSDWSGQYYDPMLIIELQRQAGVLVPHRFGGVPQGWQFVFRKIGVEMLDVPRLALRDDPTDVVMAMELAKRYHHDDMLVGLDLFTRYYVEDVEIARVTGSVSFMPRQAYADMRGKMREAKRVLGREPVTFGEPIAPEMIGRINQDNVVLSGVEHDETRRETRSSLIVMQEHPCLFDHRLDHIPGMLLLEGQRQMASLAGSQHCGVRPGEAVLTDIDTKFTDFGEFELPVECAARVLDTNGDGAIKMEVDLLQEAGPICTGKLQIAPAGA